MAAPKRVAVRLVAVPAVVLAIVVCGAARAGAHEGLPGLTNVLDSVTPPVPGVGVQVVASVADELVVSNPTPTPLEVLAESGQPFLRIDASGVKANLNSASWYLDNDPIGAAPVPARAVPGAPADWVQVSAAPSWGWFDHRLHAQSLAVPPTTKRGVAVRVSSWLVPMTYGHEAVTVRGHRQYRVPTGYLTSVLLGGPPGPGLEAGVVGGALPAFFLRSNAADTVVVLGPRGEPVAKLGPSGTSVNLASPTWVVTAEAQGQQPQVVVDPAGAPVWESISALPRLTWLEPRAGYGPAEPPTAVQRRSSPTVLIRWHVPLVLASGRHLQLTGETLWVPVQSLRHRSSGVPLDLGLGAMGLLVGVAWAAAKVARPIAS